MHIRRMVLSNFRCIRNLDAVLEPLTVLIGPNGSGKTTVLEALDLWRQAMCGNLRLTINQMQGLSSFLLTLPGSGTPELEMALDLDLGKDGRFSLQLDLSPKGGGYEITRETLASQRDQGLVLFHRTTNQMTQQSTLGWTFSDQDRAGYGQGELLLGAKVPSGTLGPGPGTIPLRAFFPGLGSRAGTVAKSARSPRRAPRGRWP